MVARRSFVETPLTAGLIYAFEGTIYYYFHALIFLLSAFVDLLDLVHTHRLLVT